jgi:hypothetical protein
MTTKTITGDYAAGYTMNNSVFSGLYIGGAAKIGGIGLTERSASAVSIANYGSITSTNSSTGVNLGEGTLSNFGSISAVVYGSAGVYLHLGGLVQNGDFFAPGSITGAAVGIAFGQELDEPARVINYGYVEGGGDGIRLFTGSIQNSGYIKGGNYGISTVGAVTVSNTGTIAGANNEGIYLYGGGSLTNAGLITGKTGVVSHESPVYNTGTIDGTFGGAEAYVTTLINGSATYKTALIEGGNVGVVGADSTITNFGTIKGGSAKAVYDYGVDASGVITNGGGADTAALIEGFTGVYTGGSTTVFNYGTIDGNGGVSGADGVVLYYGGLVTNGSHGLRTALIEGYGGVAVTKFAGTVDNLGTIKSTGGAGGFGVSTCGGVVTNGPLTIKTALIEGGYGVTAANAVAITNYGSIVGTSTSGVITLGGGSVVNGTTGDKSALIEGVSNGVQSVGVATTVTNLGTIEATAAFSRGVYESAGATVTNGRSTDTSALIIGAQGIEMELQGTITNSATITGQSGAGIVTYGGAVTNSGLSALIDGVTFGVEAKDNTATIRNTGTVRATGGAGAFGVAMLGGGTMTNGSTANSSALIAGSSGLDLQDAAAATNFGVIVAYGAAGVGVAMGVGSRLTNGAAGHATAFMGGATGVSLAAGGAAILTNFGTIVGEDGGAAVQLNSNKDSLLVEAGSTFIGAVDGDGGLLELASGAGTIVLAGHDVTVSGSMPTTPFTDFDTVRIESGASFKVSGDNTGTLWVVGGTLTSDGTVSGSGHVDIDGGVADLGAGFEEAVDFDGTSGELELGSSKTYAGEITGFSLTGKTSLDLLDIAFAGNAAATYSGSTTSGVLTISEGANTAHINLKGDYLSSTFTLSAATGGGTLVVDPPKAAATASRLVAAMAGFGGRVSGAAALDGAQWRTPPAMLTTPGAQAA